MSLKWFGMILPFMILPFMILPSYWLIDAVELARDVLLLPYPRP